LQLAADERARRAHAEQVAQLRQRVAETEQTRDDLLAALNMKLDELWRLDEQVVQRKDLEAGLRRCDADLAELDGKLTAVGQQLAALKGGFAAQPVEVGPVQVETIAGAYRNRNATLIGLGVMAATFGLCVLMVVRNPVRRRGEWEAALADIGPASGVRSSPPRPTETPRESSPAEDKAPVEDKPPVAGAAPVASAVPRESAAPRAIAAPPKGEALREGEAPAEPQPAGKHAHRKRRRKR
jgi:hypothetical protein